MLFMQKIDPTVIKDSSELEKQIQELNRIKPLASPSVQEVIETDLKLLDMGLTGEKKVMFELQNSHFPMFIIHDLYIEHKGLTAQIDYLVFCQRFIYVIECKNLYGSIEVNNRGDFIRTVNIGKKFFKEGIYSPITQNQRHIDLLMEIEKERLGSSVLNRLFGSNYANTFLPIVVLANDRTVLNDKFAKKDVKEKIIRADQLVRYIKNSENNGKNPKRNIDDLRKYAEWMLSIGTTNTTDYLEKYRKLEREVREAKASEKTTSSNSNKQYPPICPNCNIQMVKRIAKKGERQGKEFWGCPNWPKCRNIVNID